MANVKVLNKDPFTYAEERRRFLEDLQRFHTTRGTPFDRIPQIGGREIDLYRLYRTVTDLGGWQKVNNDLLWEDFQEDFNVPVACTNGAQALKYIYFRYLNIYEKVHFLGLDPDNCTDEPEEGPARKKICLPVESIPLTYNYNHHKVPESQREASNLSFDLARFSDYDKLEMSLRSGLPNEVDFSVNVCLLLSNEGRYVLKLNKSIHLLPLLMANVGIFEEGSGTMEDVMLHSWRNSESKRDFLRFWHDIVKDEKIRESIKTRNGVYKRDEMAGSEVLHLGRDLGVRDAEGQRVLQLAMLIRNLSFEEVNQQLLASSSLVFRFLMLCVHSSYGSLRQLALDTLGNLAAQMVLLPMEAMATQLIMNLIKKSLMEQDKFVIVRALEMLSKLCQLERNEAVMNESLEGETYSRIVQLLTVHDIQLIVHTLEALYQLSELGETTTNMIAHVKQAVDLLVNLITVEAQSYGPNSLIGIKVVEYVPPADPNAAHSAIPAPSRTVIQAMAPGQRPGSGIPATPHLSAADQARSDLETTASNWLQGTYETKKGSCTKLNDLFAEYQLFCSKFGIADTLTATDLLSVVKPAIPQAKIAEVEKEGHKETVLKGLSKRAKPKPFAILAGSDKVHKPSPCSVPVNSLRGPGPNWLLNSDPMVGPASTYTPTLRQRLMEPPQTPPLPHPLMTYAGATGAGAPPTGRGGRGQQLTPKGGAGGKKRGAAAASLAPPSGPGPGPGGTASPLPPVSAPVPAARPLPLPPQQLQVAGAPQTAASVLQPGAVEQILIQSSSPLVKPGSVFPAVLPPHGSMSSFTPSPLPVSAPQSAASSVSVSPGQQFPTIHQALQGDASGPAKIPANIADQGSETGFIKSLLAKKVCQNMVRQGSTTPPPPESHPDAAVSASPEQFSVLQPNSQLPVGVQQLTRSQPLLHPQQPLKAPHHMDQPAMSAPVLSYQQVPHGLVASHHQKEALSVPQQMVQTSVIQHPQQLHQGPLQQQSLHPSTVHQQAQTPAEQAVPSPCLQQGLPAHHPMVQQGAAVSATEQQSHTTQQLPRVGHPPAMQQPLPQFAHQQTQVAHLPPLQQQQQQQLAAAPKEAQHQSPAPHHGTVPQQLVVPSQLAQQQQQLSGQTVAQQQEQHIQPQNLVPHGVQPQTVGQQAGAVHSQPQYPHKSSSVSAAVEQPPPPQVQSQVIHTQPVQSPSPLVQAQPLQSQGNQTVALQAQPLQAQLPQAQPLQAQPLQAQPLQAQPLQAQPLQAQLPQAQPPQAQLPQAQPLQAQPLQAQPLQAQPLQAQLPQAQLPQNVSQGVQAQSTPQAVHSQPAHNPLQSPSLSQGGQALQNPPQGVQVQSQQVVHMPQGHQVIVHQQAGQSPGQIHIQQRVGGQQIMLPGNPPQQVHLRPGPQQIIVQQQQNHMVIQGQAGLQQILHQPVQQLTIQGQSQPLRIQTQSPQPMVIQLPMYQLPQITSSQMAACASLPTTVVQTTAGSLSQSSVMPYRTIIPHQSASVVAAMSSHRASVPATVPQGPPASGKPEADHAQATPVRDAALSGDSVGACEAQTVTVQSGGDSSHPSVCNAPSQPVDSEGRTVTPGPGPAIPAARAVQTQWSAGSPLCPAPSHPSSYSSSSISIPHPAAASSSSTSSSSSSSSPHTPLPCSQPGPTLPSPSMSITHAILSGQEVHRPGSNSPHAVRPCAESHPHPARDNGHTNGSSSGTSVSTKKDCNGLGEVNGGLASPDSASNDLPPSPMEGPKRLDHIPNGLLEGNSNSWKEGGPLSKDLLYNMAEKMAKINGVTHHLENGDVRLNQTMDVDQDSQLSQAGETPRRGSEDTEVEPPKKQEVWHVNGLSSLGTSSGGENHVAQPPPVSVHSKPGQVLVKQTSMEEVSLDSTDSRLVVNCSKAGDMGVRPLFSPHSSHDSDVSCDSFASSLADSVSSEKHSSQAPPIFPRPSTSTAPSPSSSCSSVFPEVPLVLAGTIPKSEAINKKNKKKYTPKPKAEKPPSKSKKRKGGKNAAPESPTPPPPAKPLVMEYMCEWAGCGRCFDSARLVYIHASKTHVPALPEAVCHWHGCEPLRRKRWSLVTHLQDHHCSEMAQRAACQRRFQAAQTAAAASSPQPPTPLQQAPALVYPPDAAMQAIKRFHIKPPFAEFADPREGPVTKHIRLTAALILRNLARYSSLGRSLIKHRERQLSYVTISACESSTALSSCLWEILHDT